MWTRSLQTASEFLYETDNPSGTFILFSGAGRAHVFIPYRLGSQHRKSGVCVPTVLKAHGDDLICGSMVF